MRETDPTTEQVKAFLKHKRPVSAFLVAYRREIGIFLAGLAIIFRSKFGL